MRGFETAVCVALVALGGAWTVPSAAATAKAKAKAPVTKAAPALKDSSIWSATTYEAASKDVNKAVLAQGKKATIVGEVVDVSCYLQLGKRGAAHVECGGKCIANGQPIGILDKADNLYILFPEEHHPRRDGQVDVKSRFALLLSKQVSVAGTVSKVRGYNALFIGAETYPDTLAAN